MAMVHQELAFCENLSVAENLCLGRLPARGAFCRPRRWIGARRDACSRAIGADARRRGGRRRADHRRAADGADRGRGRRRRADHRLRRAHEQPRQQKPSASTSSSSRLKARGVTCIYVSHRMPEIFRLCDAVSVLRDGRHVATRPTPALDEDDARVDDDRPPARRVLPRSTSRRRTGDEVLRVEGSSSPGRFEDVSFTLRAGEVVGLAGLVGAGRSEIAQAALRPRPRARRARLRATGGQLAIRPAERGHAIAASAWCRRIASGRDWCCP